jgi:hypothetical protein
VSAGDLKVRGAGARTVLCALAATVVALALPAAAPAAANPAELRKVMFVGNNWAGTADVVDRTTYRRLARINVVPDLQARLRELLLNPVDLAYFTAIRELVGEGHHQYVDDMFSSHDGRVVYVSRPSLRDVVGIDLRTHQIVWRIPVEGNRADHMALSPDGRQLLVSASTANKVHVIDPVQGRLVGSFPSGDSPHESNFSRDGARIFHASIGLVYTPGDQPALDTAKGERVFEVVDAKTLQVLKRLDIGRILAAQGHPGMSSAIRPMAIAPDERTFYFQLSFLHGFVEFDLARERVLRIARLPVSAQAQRTPREQYLLDSAHHGLAMNEQGTKLCVAGTMSDYAAIVSRATFAPKLFDVGRKPYWATNGGDGTCWVSSSGDDRVVVLDYDGEKEVARIDVGDHPQRVRDGVIRTAYLDDPGPGLRIVHKPARRGIGVRGGRLGVGCAADGAEAVGLRACTVRLRATVRRGRVPITLGAGRATAPRAGRRTLTVRVRLTPAGRALLARRPRGFRATIAVAAEDALGGRPTVAERVTLRRGVR